MAGLILPPGSLTAELCVCCCALPLSGCHRSASQPMPPIPLSPVLLLSIPLLPVLFLSMEELSVLTASRPICLFCAQQLKTVR